MPLQKVVWVKTPCVPFFCPPFFLHEWCFLFQLTQHFLQWTGPSSQWCLSARLPTNGGMKMHKHHPSCALPTATRCLFRESWKSLTCCQPTCVLGAYNANQWTARGAINTIAINQTGWGALKVEASSSGDDRLAMYSAGKKHATPHLHHLFAMNGQNAFALRGLMLSQVTSKACWAHSWSTGMFSIWLWTNRIRLMLCCTICCNCYHQTMQFLKENWEFTVDNSKTNTSSPFWQQVLPRILYASTTTLI